MLTPEARAVIAELVAAAPSVSPEQRVVLAYLLRPDREPLPERRKDKS